MTAPNSTGWIETYRGSVAPWECDVTEHFTIAYYFDRLEQAEANLIGKIGLADAVRRGGFKRRYDLRFAREMRAGAAFHVEAAVTGPDPALRLGYRFVDSANGEVTTWIDAHWDIAAPAGVTLGEWNGPTAEERPVPAGTEGFVPTAAGRVRPHEIDEYGRIGLGALIHKFTDSSVQIGAAVGLTADFIETGRRGLSTFELALEISRAPGVGEPYASQTGLLHLGGSSLRFLHVMRNAETGEEFARLGQYGVQLDLDKRRPAPLNDAMRARAQKLVVPMG
jgi:acyl-CoA thioesterase FadM